MTTTQPIVQPDSVSHYTTDSSSSFSGYKEEVYLSFKTSWRGADAVIKMHADRYEYHGGGITVWRIVAENLLDTEGRSTFTDTARARLSDQFKDSVKAWLDSPAYRQSYQRSIYAMVLREFYSLRPWAKATDNARRAIAKYESDLGPDGVMRLVEVADAFDRFVVEYESASKEGEDS